MKVVLTIFVIVVCLGIVLWCCSSKAETPTEHNIAVLNKNSAMLEAAFASVQPQASCAFNWTFPRGVDPVRSKGFVFKRNPDGTITAWSACNPKFKRRK